MTLSVRTMESPMGPGTDRVDFSRIVIVADDLTGACDSGAAFLASGRRVRVVLDAGPDFNQLKQAEYPGEQGVWAFTTETRDLAEEQAGGRVGDCMNALGPLWQDALAFKKVDSAARGHFGAEISAALRSSVATLALVAPAFPEAGRTVEGGVLRVRDWSGQDTAKPLRELFSQEVGAAVDGLPVCSEQELEQRIVRAMANGTRFLVCDARTQADLERLTAAALRVHEPLLWVGSAGLAHALAGLLPLSAAKPRSHPVQRHGRTLLFVGSPHPITSLQVLHLEQSPHAASRAPCRIPHTDASPQDVVAAFTAEPVAALILTGGDTAAFVLQALGASSIDLAGEVAQGISWGFVEGGLADGCVVITKSGGFGERDALVQAFEFCERRSYETA
jgi:uncharacterized protein YgbK (DUF1537 family)